MRAKARKSTAFYVIVVFLIGLYSENECAASTVTIGYQTVDGIVNNCLGQVSSAYTGTAVTFSDSCSAGESYPGLYSLNTSTSIAASATLTNLRLDFTLGAAAHGQVVETGGPYSNAFVNVDDTLTVLGGSGGGFLVMNWAIGGGAVADGRFGSNTTLILRPTIVAYTSVVCGPDLEAIVAAGACSSSQPFLTEEIPFTFGQVVGIRTALSVELGTGRLDGQVDQTGGARADYYSNPVQLQSVVVLDSNRRLVSSASVVSDSGFDYASVNAVPEPGTGLMVFMGIGWVAIGRYMKKPTRRQVPIRLTS